MQGRPSPDCCSLLLQVSHFEEFSRFARSKGFQVYIIDVMADAQTCLSRNTHNRTLADIEQVSDTETTTTSPVAQREGGYVCHLY